MDEELREEFKQKKRDITQLRSQLYALSGEKQNLFQQLKTIHSKMHPHSKAIKQLKGERDSFTQEVKSLKGEREKLNLVVKEKSVVKKEVDDRKKGVLEKADRSTDRPENPGRIKAEIRHLETKIETEVMPFTKEQEMTKHIKLLKARLKELDKVDTLWKEVNTVSADFSQARRKAQDLHQDIQQKAHLSQEKHQMLTKHIEDLKKLREEEKPIAEKELQLKVQIEELKKKADEVNKRLNELAKVLNEESEQSYNQMAKRKGEEVQEKLKKGKKLNMDDILAFQATKE
ncbi:hypothetical protein J4444_00780 [Candidatus Woesearchaeota archaeon]|nr:hypothetical protein [Candidatus Woesearchaeota archaeon]